MINKLLALKNAYISNEDGATAIEYALIAAGISLAIVAAVFTFGDELEVLFDGLAGNLSGDQ
jgi:pilus assembly protein Flp/PilA